MSAPLHSMSVAPAAHSSSLPSVRRRLQLRLDSRMEELARLADHTAACWSQSPDLQHLVDLCLEEMISNTIKYGLQGEAGHVIDVLVEESGSSLVIEIRDDAPYFNAFESLPVPALDTPLEERPIGGLGVHLVRSMMDEVSMRRVGAVNLTRLVRHLARPAP